MCRRQLILTSFIMKKVASLSYIIMRLQTLQTSEVQSLDSCPAVDGFGVAVDDRRPLWLQASQDVLVAVVGLPLALEHPQQTTKPAGGEDIALGGKGVEG